MDSETKELLRLILAELRAIRAGFDGEELEPACPHCGGTELDDTSTDKPRLTCKGPQGCGKSFDPKEAVNG